MIANNEEVLNKHTWNILETQSEALRFDSIGQEIKEIKITQSE